MPGTNYHIQEDIIGFFFTSRGFKAKAIKEIMREKLGTNRPVEGIKSRVQAIRHQIVDEYHYDPRNSTTRRWNLDFTDLWIITRGLPRDTVIYLVTIDEDTADAIQGVSICISKDIMFINNKCW